MATIGWSIMRCPVCSKAVSDIFPYCPYCGKRLRQPLSLKGFFTVAMVLGVLMLGYFAMSDLPDAPNFGSMAASTNVITPTPTQNTFTNSIGMEFVEIPAGEFDMGSPSNEADRYAFEGPVHHVKISNEFYIGKYEVTQKQWRDVMGNSPSKFKGDDLPVERVSWNDVQEFIKKLNEKEGGNKYRLPTDAEWEYAARAGTTTRYSFGDDDSIFGSKLGDYAWYNANSEDKTHIVGQKKPNPWGLYDMYGNVWEWVQDNWHGNYNGAPTDGSAWKGGDDSDRVFRGCSWNDLARSCRSAFRARYDAVGLDIKLGFRLLMENAEATSLRKVTPTSSSASIVAQTS